MVYASRCISVSLLLVWHQKGSILVPHNYHCTVHEAPSESEAAPSFTAWFYFFLSSHSWGILFVSEFGLFVDHFLFFFLSIQFPLYLFCLLFCCLEFPFKFRPQPITLFQQWDACGLSTTGCSYSWSSRWLCMGSGLSTCRIASSAEVFKN